MSATVKQFLEQHKLEVNEINLNRFKDKEIRDLYIYSLMGVSDRKRIRKADRGREQMNLFIQED